MLIADGGGGYGGTDWMSKDVRFMWSTISNQDTAPHYDVVEGWRKTADLTLTHRGQVQMYRDNLASVWPPSKSPAAAAYIERLDKLLADLQATHDAASANYTTFSTVTLTLSLARHKLKPIFDEYEANQQLNLDWQAKQDQAAKVKDPVPTPAPGVPPVSASRQEELNNKARAIMYDLSSTLISGQAQLKKPIPYRPNGDSSGNDDEGNRNSGSTDGFAVPPVIPPPGSSSSGSASVPVAPPHTAPVSPPGTSPNNLGAIGSGPVLGGIGSPVINPPSTGLPVPGPAPTPPGPGPGIIGPPGAPGLMPSVGLLPNGTKLPENGLLKPGMTGGPIGRMAMPSGGVIGANPGSGMIGQMPNGAPRNQLGGPARVNPVGGVIGQQGGAPTAPRGGAGRVGSSPIHGLHTQNGPMAGNQGRGRSGRQTEGDQNRWDPDNPWATEQGVDPVVLPHDEQGPIDPGPAIGYSR
ncbi:hypothetical protein [Actinoplanes sp. NPDC049118]|uniref:hypothetical protein n=1 Tax=Actinoplanes sp. NPDC049118 TaxID=3155769 RepID=UPI0033F88D88